MTRPGGQLRVVQLASALVAPLGGAEVYAVELAKGLAGRGHSVAVATSWIDEATRAQLIQSGVEVRHCRVWRPYSAKGKGPGVAAKIVFHGLDLANSFRVPRSYRWLRDFDGIVHVHRFQGVGAGVLDGHGTASVVHTVHDYALVDTNATSARGGIQLPQMPVHERGRLRLQSVPARRADAVIFPSPRTERRHGDLGLSLRAGRSYVIPHGWRLASATGATGEQSRSLDLVYMGKLTENKGVRNLVDAWGDLRGGAGLLVAGDGPLAGLVDSAGSTSVRALGWVGATAKADLLRSCRALIFPSVWPENFPLVVAEAMLAGCPVIATPQAAEPLVAHEVNGLVAESDSPADLRAAMVRMLNDDELAERLSVGAAATGRELDFERHLDRLEEIYRSVHPRQVPHP